MKAFTFKFQSTLNFSEMFSPHSLTGKLKAQQKSFTISQSLDWLDKLFFYQILYKQDRQIIKMTNRSKDV